MKLTLAVCLLCSSLAYADQAADSFGTGMAYALQQQILATQQGQNPANAPTPKQQQGHFDVRDNYGKLLHYNFYSLHQCNVFVEGVNGELNHGQCVWVEKD